MEANPGYALSCLAEALRTASDARNDSSMRERAKEKAAQWESIFAKMSDGSLLIGSRAPAGDPFWVTLEVIGGGFATGRHKAALQSGDKPNIALLGLGGAQELEEMLHSGKYRIDYPESTAMLVVTWLLLRDRIEEAVAILAEISPWFDRLRFYPYPAETSVTPSTCICAHTLGDVRENLSDMVETSKDTNIKRNFQRMSLQRAIHVLWPLEVECVQLFLETFEPPSVEVGWPLQHFAETWKDKAASLLQKCQDARKNTVDGVVFNGKKTKQDSKRGFPFMLRCLEKCVAAAQLPRCASDAIDIEGLKARDVGILRAFLKGWVAKKQKPGSEQHAAYSSHKVEQVPEYAPADFASVLLNRTEGLDLSSGLDDPACFTQPVLETEAKTLPRALIGKDVPKSIANKLHMCVIDTPQALIEKGLVSSSEMLGALVPRISAEVTGACLQDPILRKLHFALKASFAKRRGLMLLTMEHQVRIDEIPWYKPIEFEVNKAGGTVEKSLQTLREVVKMAFEGFPQTILPNKLIQTLRELAKSAKLDIQFVEEMPVDIFQGQFSPKFTSVSCLSAHLLQGTLYETYYGLADDFQQLILGVDKTYSLVSTCARRAGLQSNWSHGGCAETGTVVEQQLLLTTHNLASLFSALSLEDLDFPSIVHRCATYIYRTLAVAADAVLTRERLTHTKNAAYAWRQLIFFISMIGHSRGKGQPEQIVEVITAACSALQPEPSEKHKSLNERIAKHLISPLWQALGGKSPQEPFLGWTRREHWFWE
mmetsp:Transcript_104030/g.164261  ORF Transcript_104030/g.164261 Transcript_104030/m.164261 type:complete len:767 (+) Transcript_104030:63-2363(+)